MAGTEHGILQALGGSLLGAMVINSECFLEVCDSDVQQQQQQRSVGCLADVSPDKVAFKVSNPSNGQKSTAEVHFVQRLLKTITWAET